MEGHRERRTKCTKDRKADGYKKERGTRIKEIKDTIRIKMKGCRVRKESNKGRMKMKDWKVKFYSQLNFLTCSSFCATCGFNTAHVTLCILIAFKSCTKHLIWVQISTYFYIPRDYFH